MAENHDKPERTLLSTIYKGVANTGRALVLSAMGFVSCTSPQEAPSKPAVVQQVNLEEQIRSYIDQKKFTSRQRVGDEVEAVTKDGIIMRYRFSGNTSYVTIVKDGKNVGGFGLYGTTLSALLKDDKNSGTIKLNSEAYAKLEKDVQVYFTDNFGTDPKPEPKPVVPEPKPQDPKPEVKPEPKPEVKPDQKSDYIIGPWGMRIPVAKQEPKPEPKSEVKPEAKKPDDEPYGPPLPPLELRTDARVYVEAGAASNKSTQQRYGIASVRTGFIDGFVHAMGGREREIISDDKIKDILYGGYGEINLYLLRAGISGGLRTNERTTLDSQLQSDPNFIVQTDTDVTQKIESRYLAINGRFQHMGFRPRATLYHSLDKISVDTEAIVNVDNLTLPAPQGDYTQIISSSLDEEIETLGAQLGFETGDALRVGSLFNVERTEISLDDSKIDVYRLDVFASYKANRFGISGGLGKRLIDAEEENDGFDPAHGYFNIAGQLGPVAAFGSFWRLDRPGAGAGLVIGEGDAIPLIMDYRDQLAWDKLDMMKHMGPEERKAYFRLLEWDFLTSLGQDDNMRFMLFGGAQRDEELGKKEWHWFGQAALNLPITEKFNILPYFRREESSLEKITEGGVVLMPGSWKIRLSGGLMELGGRKDEDAEFIMIGVEK